MTSTLRALPFRTLLHASAAMLVAGSASAQTVRATPTVPPGIASAPSGAVKGSAADAALPPGPPVTASQGTATEAELKTWLTSLLGAALTPNRPVQFTPAGDHFDVLVPIALPPAQGGKVQSLRLTATARPLDGGKWSVGRIKVEVPAIFTLMMPMPPKDGDTGPSKGPSKSPGNGSDKSPAMAPVTYTLNIGAQDGTAIIDPTFATASTWTTSGKDITVHTQGGPMAQDSTIGATTSVTTMVPAGADRVDLRSEGTLTGYSVLAPATADTPAIKIGMDKVRVAATMQGMSRTRAMTLTQSMAGLVNTALATPTGQTPKVTPEMISTMLGALRDFASEMSVVEEFEGLAFKFGDYGATLDESKFGFAAKSDDGMLRATMDLALAGLALPDLPLGPMEALIPQRLSMRPYMSGIAVADLARIGEKASRNQEPSDADVQALFSHGGIVSGLESLILEVGGATFTGQGKSVMQDLKTVTGSGQITVDGFDSLFKKVSSMPMLAQGVPVMIFLKGIGRTVNGKLVYDISYDGTKILVNDVDLAAMAGGGGAPTAPDPGPRKAPVRPNQPNQRR